MFMAFSGGFFLKYVAYSGSFIYDIHKEQRGGWSRGHKILANFGQFFFLHLRTSSYTISKSLSFRDI